MSATTMSLMPRNRAVTAALAVAAGGAATVLGAFYFQYGLGILPCPLCLEQRKVYYVAIPLALVVAIVAAWRAPRPVVVAGLSVLALVFLFGAGLAAYHSGVEWKWWPGPQECTGPMNNVGSAKDLLNQLNTFSPVRCDEVQWSFLGLTLAGYDVLVSLALAIVALWGARASFKRG